MNTVIRVRGNEHILVIDGKVIAIFDNFAECNKLADEIFERVVLMPRRKAKGLA
jgi:hypothetical protein